MFSKYKRLVLILILLLIPGIGSNAVCAETAVSEQPQIYADAVTIKAGNIASLPVLIKNNPGMMGYLITVEYDSEKIEIESVRAGKLSENGIFDYNTSPEHADGALILWSYTKEVAGDGTLFWLNIKAKENLETDKTVIRLKCSEEDTFNEKYETVSPECIPIEISGGKETGSDNSKIAQSGKNEQAEDSTAAKDENVADAQNDSSMAAQMENSNPMQKDTADMAQPEQSEKTDGLSDGSQNNQTGVAGEDYVGESADGGKEVAGGEVETTDGKTIVIDDVVKSRKDDETEDCLLIIGTAAAGVVLVGVLGVVWWKMRKIKGKRNKSIT